jgi:hypothetical protein
MIDQMYLMLYNLLFTSLPPLAIGKYSSVLEVCIYWCQNFKGLNIFICYLQIGVRFVLFICSEGSELYYRTLPVCPCSVTSISIICTNLICLF